MSIAVLARWDPDALVWVATSDDVPGLVTEAATVEGLREKILIMIPELLKLNDGPSGAHGDVPLSLRYEEDRVLRIA